MSIHLIGVMLGAVAVAAVPFIVQFYLRRLPVAPACPSCSATTRVAGDRRWLAMEHLLALTTTSVAECARCGWRGRMRWRWATDTIRRGGG